MDKNTSKRVWGITPAGFIYGGGNKPGTKEFFENVLKNVLNTKYRGYLKLFLLLHSEIKKSLNLAVVLDMMHMNFVKMVLIIPALT